MVFQKDQIIRQLNEDLIDLNNTKAIKGISVAPKGYEHIDFMKSKLAMAHTEMKELKQDLVANKRIQIEQSKALEKLSNENDFPVRMKGLIDELRVEKDMNQKLKDEC